MSSLSPCYILAAHRLYSIPRLRTKAVKLDKHAM